MKKKGQIWVETVLYTLIGLAIIGVVLAIVTPKIENTRDRILVEQSIESLNGLNLKINEVIDRGKDNVRIPSLRMRQGELYINGSEDKIIFILRGLRKPYSEPEIPIEINDVSVVSEETSGSNNVYLTLDYANFVNITYNRKDMTKKFDASVVPYKFSIKNLGRPNPSDPNQLIEINIEEVSGR